MNHCSNMAGSCVDPTAELERTLFYSGLVSRSNGQRNRPIYFLMSGLTYINLALCVLTTNLYILESHPFDDKIEAIQCAISFIHLLGKIFNLKTRKDRFWRLLDDARTIWADLEKDPKNKELLAEESCFVRKAQTAIVLLALWPVPLSIVMTLARNLGLPPGQDWELVYKNWDPLRDSLGEDYYFSRATYEVLLMLYTLYLFAGVYLAIFVPCLLAAVFMKALVRMLASEEGDLDIRSSVLLHQRILNFISDINQLFSGQMCLDMILSALYISFRSYQLIQMVNNNDPRALGTIFFLTLCFGGPFIVCLSGHIVTDMSEKVHRKAFAGDWTVLPRRERRALAFLLARAARPSTLHYKGFMTFNMDQYGVMVKTTYSYITLLTGK